MKQSACQQPRLARRRFLASLARCAATATVGVAATSCGTILYPERRGQPRGPLDPGVVVLDAIGLLFFLIPGIIAFAVDFSTGAIYLPPPAYMPISSRRRPRPDLSRVEVAREDLTRGRIEEVVGHHVGKPVILETGRFRASSMTDLAEFGESAERLSDPQRAGPPAYVRFL